jgi:3-oxoacyl-[acyl-carrier protein] reductase
MSERQVVLITGASGGLGVGLVKAFAAADWQVVAASRSPIVECRHDTDGALVHPMALDVTNSTEVESVFAEVLQQFSRLDALVNNAGIIADATLAQMTAEQWDSALDVNLRGAFLCSKAAARPMIRQRDGHIVNISSHAARRGPHGQANYAAAKAGLVGLTQSLAKELGSRNVRVNAIFPGVMPTRMTANFTPERLDEFAKANALRRINSVEEVARFIVFLASTQNISGQVFQLDSRIAPWV